jgi:hypothetical protein
MKRLGGALFLSALLVLMLAPVSAHVNNSLVNNHAVWADGQGPIPPFPGGLWADGQGPIPPFPGGLWADGQGPIPPFPGGLWADGQGPIPPFPGGLAG